MKVNRTPNSLSVEYELDERFTKAPMLIPPFPATINEAIGLLTVAWGQYELIFDRLLSALVLATGDKSEPNWQFISYKRRRKYCRRLSVSHFRKRPKLSKFITDTLDKSLAVHNARNLLTHGKMCALVNSPAEAESEVLVEVEERSQDGPELRQFSETDIRKTAYEALQLGGRLNRRDESPVDDLPSRDIRALLDLLSPIPHPEPIRPKQPAPPESSQA